jgi:hypothetical protein
MFSIIAAIAELDRNIIRYGIRRPTAVFHRDRTLELQAAGLSYPLFATLLQIPLGNMFLDPRGKPTVVSGA